MYGKGKVCLAGRGKQTCWGETGIVDKEWVVFALPMNRIRGIGDNRIKGLIVPVIGIDQGIFVRNIKKVVVDVVQKHIDAAEVVGCQFDLLPIKTAPHILLAQNLGKFKQQRAGAISRIIHFVDLCFTHGSYLCLKFTHLLRGVVFST